MAKTKKGERERFIESNSLKNSIPVKNKELNQLIDIIPFDFFKAGT